LSAYIIDNSAALAAIAILNIVATGTISPIVFRLPAPEGAKEFRRALVMHKRAPPRRGIQVRMIIFLGT
jgi:hypothetical protein